MFLARCVGSVIIAYAIAACLYYHEYAGVAVFAAIFAFAIVEWPPETEDDDGW